MQFISEDAVTQVNVIEDKNSLDTNSEPEKDSSQDNNLPTGIFQIKKRIEVLKKELIDLRRKRSHENPTSKLASTGLTPGKKSKNAEISANDIRQRYRAEVGFRTPNVNTNTSAKLSKRPDDKLELSKENENKLFYLPLNSMALKGNIIFILLSI